jgi:hypothetical protein
MAWERKRIYSFTVPLTLALYECLERDPVPTAQDASWAPGSFRVCAENLASSGILFPDQRDSS